MCCWLIGYEEDLKPRERDHTDLELIDSFKEGDTDAFRLLVERYKDVSLSLACSILKDMHLAEDVLQDAFMKVYHKIHTFKYKASFTTWLYRIVVNTSYNALKKEKNHLKVPEDTRPELAEGWESEVSAIRKGEQQKYIQWALEKLRSDEALALRLHYLCELKLSEIEKITGFRKSKIKVDLHRGRKNMEFYLQKQLGIEVKDLL